ncbi:MAG: hypothetical protein HFJ48_03945 [Clostridia bacterium]|nr:hypothetical protein [Clostridia bacterium]
MKKRHINILLLNLICILFIFSISVVSYVKTNSKELKYIAVFIEFSDSDSGIDESHHLDDEECVANAEKIFNSDEYFEMNTVNGIIEVPSFKKYYEMQSYGKLSITTEIFPRQDGKVVSYTDSHPMGYYLKYSQTNPIGYKDAEESLQRETELINNAVQYVSKQIEASGITANELDTENNGIVDAISFFIDGCGVTTTNISWGDLLWSHKTDNYGVNATILGKKVIPYNIIYTYDYTETAGVFSLNRGTYGTIIHEFGHTLGYVDLYRFGQSQSKPVGFYDIMGNAIGSNPQNFLTYFTSEYYNETNWHQPLPEINETTQGITLYKPNFIDTNEKRAIKITTHESSEEYFIIEYHEKQNTYDTSAADESGIIIYRVNEKNKFSGNKDGGEHGEKDHIFVFRPNETNLGEAKGELSQATLNMKRSHLGKSIGDSNKGFDNQTIYYSDGSNSGIIVDVVEQTNGSVTFNITFPKMQGSGTQSDPYIISNAESFLYFMQRDTKNKYYKIIDNIDFADVDNYPKIDFQGNLDGNNKTLSNITAIGTGVFSNVGDYNIHSVIENLNIENINITPDIGDHIGGFISVATNASIKNINLKSGSITNIASTINIISSTGGFVGSISNATTIENCTTSLNVHSEKNVGGFIGINMNGTIKNCHAYGQVTSNSNLGGFIGLQYIMDETYNIPQDAYYYYIEGKTIDAVGGYTSFHNLVALPSDQLGKGIVGILLKEDEEPAIISEAEVLNYFGLTKKENYILGFTIGSNVTNIRQLLSSYPNVTLVSFRKANGEETSTGIVATNMKFTLKFNQTEYNYTVVVKGDVNGDGLIYATDYVSIKNHIMGKTLLQGAYLLAADVNNDNNVYATDYVSIRNYIMKNK